MDVLVLLETGFQLRHPVLQRDRHPRVNRLIGQRTHSASRNRAAVGGQDDATAQARPIGCLNRVGGRGLRLVERRIAEVVAAQGEDACEQETFDQARVHSRRSLAMWSMEVW